MRNLFIISLFLVFSATAMAQSTQSKHLAPILVGPSLDPMSEPMKGYVSAADIPAFEKDIKGVRTELINEFAKIYSTEFTAQEIKELLKFYQSPVGKKLAEKSPVFTQKGMAVGQKLLMPIIQKYMGKQLQQQGANEYFDKDKK